MMRALKSIPVCIFRALAFIVLWSIETTVAAAQEPDVDGQNWLRAHVFVGFDFSNSIPVTTDESRRALRELFDYSDHDGGGVSARDFELSDQDQKARIRAEQIRNILNFDYDGDGVVTREEVERGMRFGLNPSVELIQNSLFPADQPAKPNLERRIADLMKSDTNGDDKITYDEMIAAPDAPLQLWSLEDAGRRVPLSLDANGDGTVTSDEFEQAIDRLMAEIDTDGDGIISSAERISATQRFEPVKREFSLTQTIRQQKSTMRRKALFCALPKPADGARVVLVGTSKGHALSNAWLGDDNGKANVAHIEIESGDQPLYVVATSLTSIIWQVTGAKERVATFVAMAQKTGTSHGEIAVGVEGLSKDKVYIPPNIDCLIPLNSSNPESARVAGGGLAGLIGGRNPDDVVGIEEMSSVNLPGLIIADGKYHPVPLTQPPAGTSGWERRSHSGSEVEIINIEPTNVISNVAVKTDRTLP